MENFFKHLKYLHILNAHLTSYLFPGEQKGLQTFFPIEMFQKIYNDDDNYDNGRRMYFK